MSPLLPLLLALSPAQAGDILVHSSVPCEVELNGLPVVRLTAPGDVALPEVDAGSYTFVVVRGPDDRQLVPVRVPAVGGVKLDISEETVTTDSPGDAAPGETDAPVVVVRGAPGQRFSILLDGGRRAVLGPDHPLRLDGLAAGEHTFEVRTADDLTIWARGTLTLQTGDQVELFVEEGRMVQPTGRDGAWRPR